MPAQEGCESCTKQPVAASSTSSKTGRYLYSRLAMQDENASESLRLHHVVADFISFATTVSFFKANVISHSFRRSFPNRTRCAGLRFGFWCETESHGSNCFRRFLLSNFSVRSIDAKGSFSVTVWIRAPAFPIFADNDPAPFLKTPCFQKGRCFLRKWVL